MDYWLKVITCIRRKKKKLNENTYFILKKILESCFVIVYHDVIVKSANLEIECICGRLAWWNLLFGWLVFIDVCGMQTIEFAC